MHWQSQSTYDIMESLFKPLAHAVIPRLRQKVMKQVPRSRQNTLKTIPYRAAHPR